MDKRTTTVFAAGILVTILLYFVNIYLAGIAIVILLVIVMSLAIMQETTFRPLIEVQLQDDAKAVILTNSGNSPAKKIHVALVPVNLEYDVDSLAVDSSHTYIFPSMIQQLKVVVSFENEKGESFSRTQNLSSSEGNYDPLKPVFPLFGWK